jgi:septal ring factor EnvC (AmiA/AmiB activator)
LVEVTNELIYDILKKVQEQLGRLEAGQRGIQEELRAIREHQLGMQRDISNIYDSLARLEVRVDHIERRLELTGTTT